MSGNGAHATSADGGVAVVVVPRERGAVALDSLNSILRNTPELHRLIYVDGCLPRSTARRVREILTSAGHTYLRSHGWLHPNEARNLGLQHTRNADHVVFIDNDILVDPGWLDRLLECAAETGAGVVGPLYLEGDESNPLVHCAGGRIEKVVNGRERALLLTKQYELGVPVAELHDFERAPTGLVEFHCVLVSRAFLDAIGNRFDEELKTTREHVDLCLLAGVHGFDVYLEPASRIRYGNEVPPRLADLDYFMYRWSDTATADTVRHFEAKWDVDLDAERANVIRGRRDRFRSALEQSTASKVYVKAWQLAQRTGPSRATAQWVHRQLW